ncbi:MAG TPA: peroxiredoxin [Verrucomicrobiae bacterium]|jgi:peroxiredoxin|nr:peroxiredoxin [Verrucomicrobiae bacterium]
MIKIGDALPDVQFNVPGPEGMKPLRTADVFAGKTVALFAVPGAFTPTCSARHLPSFRDHLADFKAKGVDVVACTAVNDHFVMGAWAKDQNVFGDIVMLADGSGEFARAVGLDADFSKFGMGPRSKRYSMIVKDGMVSEVNVEEGGEYKVSSAEYLLGQLS